MRITLDRHTHSGSDTYPSGTPGTVPMPELKTDLLKKYDKTLALAMHTLMVEEAEKRALQNKLEGKAGMGKLMTNLRHSASSLFSKSQVNEILKTQKESLEEHAKKTLGVLPEAMEAMKNPEVQKLHTLFQRSRFISLANGPHFFGLLRYIHEKKITLTEKDITAFSAKTEIKTPRDLFQQIVTTQKDEEKKKKLEAIDKNKALTPEQKEEEKKKIPEMTKEDYLDENLLYTQHVTAYETLDSMSRVNQKANYTVKKDKDGNEVILAQRRQHWKNFAINGGYIGAGIATKVFATTTFPPAIIPITLFSSSAGFSLHRAVNKERKEKRTPARFNKQLLLAAAQSYKTQSLSARTPEDRQQSKELSEILLTKTKAPISAEDMTNYVTNSASLGELEAFYATIQEFDKNINRSDSKINPVYIGYINELKKTIFQTIYEKSKNVTGRETIISVAKKAKEREKLLDLNIDKLITKENGLVDGTLTEGMKNIDWKDTSWTITKSFGKSALFFGLGSGAAWGFGAAKEYFGSHLHAVVDPLKTQVADAHPALTSTISQTPPVTQTGTSGSNFTSGQNLPSANHSAVASAVSANHSPVAPQLDPAISGVANAAKDAATGHLKENMSAVDTIMKEYAAHTPTAEGAAAAKAKLNALYATLPEKERAELAVALANKSAHAALGQGPTGVPMEWLRTQAHHLSDGDWLGTKDRWYNWGTEDLGIDMGNSMAFDDWYLYNSATEKGYGTIVKTLAGITDVAKDMTYLGLTEPLEKFVRLQGHIWNIVGMDGFDLKNFEIDVYTRKILSVIMGSGGADVIDGATANELTGMIRGLKNDPENLKAIVTFLGIAGAVGIYLHKRNPKAAGEMWKDTKKFFGTLKGYVDNKPANFAKWVAAPSLYFWWRYPRAWTYNGIKGMFGSKAEAKKDDSKKESSEKKST